MVWFGVVWSGLVWCVWCVVCGVCGVMKHLILNDIKSTGKEIIDFRFTAIFENNYKPTYLFTAKLNNTLDKFKL